MIQKKTNAKPARDFFLDVYDVVRLIPPGRVTSYGAIAKYLGSAQSSRVVGYAMNSAHAVIPEVPAHRVVNRAGMLTGKHHFSTEEEMRTLLEKEGISVAEDQIVNFDAHFWDPAIELDL